MDLWLIPVLGVWYNALLTQGVYANHAIRKFTKHYETKLNRHRRTRMPLKRTPLKRKTPLRAKRKPKSNLQKRKDKMDSPYWDKKCHTAVAQWAHKSKCVICGKREPEVGLIAGHHLIRKSRSRLLRWHPVNIIPLCEEHHLNSIDMAPHSDNPLAVKRFLEKLEVLEPWRYNWLVENQDAIRKTDMRGQIEKPDWRYQLTIWEQKARDLDAIG